MGTLIDYVATFIFFFAVIEPIGTVPVFVAVIRHHADAERRATAIRAAAVSALIMVFFVVAGEVILSAMAAGRTAPANWRQRSECRESRDGNDPGVRGIG